MLILPICKCRLYLTSSDELSSNEDTRNGRSTRKFFEVGLDFTTVWSLFDLQYLHLLRIDRVTVQSLTRKESAKSYRHSVSSHRYHKVISEGDICHEKQS